MECYASACGERIAPVTQARAFAFSTGRVHHFGVLKPDDTTLPCISDGRIELRLSPRKLAPESTAHIGVRNDAGMSWSITVAGRALRETVHLTLPKGAHVLTLETPHFCRFQQSIDVRNSPVVVGVVLTPVPVISGTVVERMTGAALGGARVETDTGTETFADQAGRYALEVEPEQWPARLTARAAGYCDMTMSVPPARAAVDLDPIALSRGGRVVVDLRQREPGHVVDIALLPITRGNLPEKTPTKTLSVAKEQRGGSFAFDDVAPGRYLVLARGDGGCERFGTVVTIEAAQEAQASLTINPYDLNVRVEFDSNPLGDARVELGHAEAFWDGAFETDADGRATIRMWQGGTAFTKVFAKGLLPFGDRRAIPDADSAEWLLEVPVREVVGQVIDAKSGTPIPNAELALQMKSDGVGMLSVRAQSDQDGYFRLVPVASGLHTLRAAAKERFPATVQYTFPESEKSRKVTMRLEASRAVQLTVTDERGAPLVGARVLEFDDLVDRHIGGYTDAAGAFPILVSEGQAIEAYVVPRDGSFGVVQAKSGMENAHLRVPDGACRIVLHAVSDAGAPIPNVHVAIRYNGRVLPPEIIRAFGAMFGARYKSDKDGTIVFDHMPAGFYEFWPVGSVAELRAVAGGLGPQAPIKMAVTPGVNQATLTFSAAPR